MTDPEKNVSPEHVFHFKNGKKAHNLKDLRDAIKNMGDDMFMHHVNDTNNDFANWIEFVYKKADLADDLRKVTKQSRMVELLNVELGDFGGEVPIDEPMEEPQLPVTPPATKELPKQLHEDPIKLSEVPQTIETTDGKFVHSVSTEAPHKFIIKEFFWGVITGLLMGIILIASLMYFGVFPV